MPPPPGRNSRKTTSMIVIPPRRKPSVPNDLPASRELEDSIAIERDFHHGRTETRAHATRSQSHGATRPQSSQTDATQHNASPPIDTTSPQSPMHDKKTHKPRRAPGDSSQGQKPTEPVRARGDSQTTSGTTPSVRDEHHPAVAPQNAAHANAPFDASRRTSPDGPSTIPIPSPARELQDHRVPAAVEDLDHATATRACKLRGDRPIDVPLAASEHRVDSTDDSEARNDAHERDVWIDINARYEVKYYFTPSCCM